MKTIRYFHSMSKLSTKVNKFKCDDYLRRVLGVFHFGLIECETMGEEFLEIVECETEFGYFYKVENRELSIRGFIGRDAFDGRVIYIGQDSSRIKWAKLEGFSEAGMTDKQIWEKIGVLRHLNTLDDMILFIGGKPGYQMVGNYLLGMDTATK